MGRVDSCRRGLLVSVAVCSLFVSTIAISAAAVQPTVPVQTQQKGLTISPTLKDISLSSGLLESTNTITITNTTGSDLTAAVRAVDFTSVDGKGSVVFKPTGDTSEKYGLSKSIVLPDGPTISLPKGKATAVRVNITNGSNLAPGGHYGALVVTASSAGAAKGGSNVVSFRQQLVSLFFVKKLGGEQYGLQLQSITPDTRRAVPNTVSLRFNSTGNVHVVPRGYIQVTDPKGKVLAKGIINPESTLILPGTKRQFTTIMQTVGSSSAKGRYTTTVYYRHDGQDKFSTQLIFFTQQSSSYIAFTVTIITGVILLLVLRKKHQKRA